MKNSLSDQLLNLGLTDKKKIQQAKTEKKKTRKQNKGLPPSDAPLKAEIEASRKEKQQRDRELNQQRESERQKRAIEGQIRQLIEHHCIRIPDEAELAYQFVDDRKIKKIYITKPLQEQLLKGWIAIAILDDDRYRLVPDPIAARIEQRDPQRVIRIEQEAIDDDDPYKDYPIPDDLMW